MDPDPAIQVSILGRRVHDAVQFDAKRLHQDTIIADLDCSEANMPRGTFKKIGSAVLRCRACSIRASNGKRAMVQGFRWINGQNTAP